MIHGSSHKCFFGTWLKYGHVWYIYIYTLEVKNHFKNSPLALLFVNHYIDNGLFQKFDYLMVFGLPGYIYIYLYLEPVCVLSSSVLFGGGFNFNPPFEGVALEPWNQASSKALNLSGFQVSSFKLTAKAPENGSHSKGKLIHLPNIHFQV